MSIKNKISGWVGFLLSRCQRSLVIYQESEQKAEEERLAVEQGSADAQYSQGLLCHWGRRNPEDFKRAVEWYEGAAKQGDAEAQYNLGVLYENGRGVPQDDTLATEWYRKAAELGNARAQFNLGLLYQLGRGRSQGF